MEIKKTITKYSYRIEAKPGGGFVAHPADSSMETVEGATKEEVLKKVEEKIGGLIGKEFPAIEKLLRADPNIYRIEAKLDGGFIAHPPSSSMETVEGATREEVLQKIEKQLAAMLDPDLPKGEKVQHKDLNIGGLHVTIDKKVKITPYISSHGSEAQPALSQPGFSDNRFASASRSSAGVDPMGPILPSKDTSGMIWRIIAALIALGALAYFFLRR